MAQDAKHIIKCDASTRRIRFCRDCGAPVQWLRSSSQQRWLLLEAEAKPVRDKTIDGVAYTYLDGTALHCRRCQPITAPSASGGSAG
jgi:hypothetical protein